MKKLLKILFLTSLALVSCSTNRKEESIEKWKNEIVATEKAFAEMAAKEGIPVAFESFAANDVVVLRSKKIIIGKEAMTQFYQKSYPSKGKETLNWKPDFVDVSSSGDLGYTYGKYTYSTTDSLGQKQEYSGIFHTVWKRQADGNWKFVWD
jgi:ketosteroid isomerase-like protein